MERIKRTKEVKRETFDNVNKTDMFSKYRAEYSGTFYRSIEQNIAEHNLQKYRAEYSRT